jgi:putative inorganic carbon (HCO3(-)) transporter
VSTILVVAVAAAAVVALVRAFFDDAVAAALLAALAFTRLPAVVLHSEGLMPAILAAVYGVAAAARARRGGTSPRRALSFAIAGVAYLLVVGLSYLWAADSTVASLAARNLGLFLVVCVGFVAVVSDARALRAAIAAMVGGGVFLSLLSLHQVATGAYGNTYGGFAQASVENIVGTTNAYRIGGPFGDPNFFGQLLVVAIALALALMTTTPSRRVRAASFASAVVCGITVFLTYSRGALIALGVVVAVWLWSNKRRGLVVGCLVAGALAIALLPGAYGSRLSQVTSIIPGLSNPAQTTDPALRGRESALIVGTRMFADHPVVGVGAANFPVHYLSYATSVGLVVSGQQLSPHNLYMEVAAEQGVVGVLVFGGIVIGAFASVKRARRELLDAGDTATAPLVAGVRNALIGYLVASLFLHAAYPQMLWLLLAFAWAMPQCVPGETRVPPDDGAREDYEIRRMSVV